MVESGRARKDNLARCAGTLWTRRLVSKARQNRGVPTRDARIPETPKTPSDRLAPNRKRTTTDRTNKSWCLKRAFNRTAFDGSASRTRSSRRSLLGTSANGREVRPSSPARYADRLAVPSHSQSGQPFKRRIAVDYGSSGQRHEPRPANATASRSGPSLIDFVFHESLPQERLSRGYLLNFTRERGMIYPKN